MIEKKFIVSSEESGQRLDLFLVQKLGEEVSRSSISGWIKAGNVFINDAVATKNGTIVTTDQTIVLHMPPPPVFDVIPTAVDFEVIAEHSDFLIINKPAGLSVHHAASAPDDITLIHGLLHRYPEFADFDDHARPGIVHRLDKNTSGVMMVARNKAALTQLAALFSERNIKKTYYAIVHGHPDKTGSIDAPIGRHRVLRHKMAAHGLVPRDAFTEYEVLSYYEGPYAFLQVTPTTGRTHQIRVHCAFKGMPIVGDNLYGKESLSLPRHALHAGRLAFTYKGKEYLFEAPLAHDMSQFLEKLQIISEEEASD